jgi:hypothetical protein
MGFILRLWLVKQGAHYQEAKQSICQDNKNYSVVKVKI